jgi:hypothetical protein
MPGPVSGLSPPRSGRPRVEAFPPACSSPSPPSTVLRLDPPPCFPIHGYGHPSPSTPACNRPAAQAGLPGFQRNPYLRDVAFDPGRAAAPRITAQHIWPSTVDTVSASAISSITWIIPTPHRLTVYASAAPLPVAPATLVTGRLARPYPGGTFPRRIALASPSGAASSDSRTVRSPFAGRTIGITTSPRS